MTCLTNPRIVRDGTYQLFADDQLMLSADLPHDIMQRIHTGKLSRFASVRQQAETIILTSPIADTVTVHDLRILKLIFSDGETGADQSVATAVWSFLLTAGLTAEEDPPFDAWTYSDMIMAFGYGDPTPMRIKAPPIKPAMSRSRQTLKAGDPNLPFYKLLRQRRTRYEYSSAAVTCDQLGEFLYYSARIQEFVEGVHYDTTMRLYPSAGATYELELYVLSHACTGLARGLYHYDPSAHSLEQLPFPVAEYDNIITQVVTNTGYQINEPQIVILITARMRRINWKNHALALANQDTGILLHNFYLAATALDLAPCAIGGLDVLMIQRAAGVSAAEEPLLAGFLIGNPKSVSET